MQTFSEARDAINAADAMAVFCEQTIAIVVRPEGYGVVAESERRAKRVIERVHPAGDTWDYLEASAEWTQEIGDMT